MYILKSILLNQGKYIEHIRMIEESNFKTALRRVNLKLRHTKLRVLIGLLWDEVNKLSSYDHTECTDYNL